MYSRFQLAIKYLKYYISASNGKGHGIHSPFVFDFIRHVLKSRQHAPVLGKIKSLRRKLLKDRSTLVIEDLGAGSGITGNSQRRVADIARHAAKAARFTELFFRIAAYYQPRLIIELGTSLGFSTSHFAAGNEKAKVITIEGAPAVAQVALRNFAILQLQNIELLGGNFDHVLPFVLQQHQTIDLAYIDGNHRRDPTLNYFRQFLEKKNNNTILIFDDIHWSREMEETWSIIKKDAMVKMTIDLFFIGLVFFRDDFKSKQHFIIRF